MPKQDFSDKYNTKLSDKEEAQFRDAMASYQLEKEARHQTELNDPSFRDTRSLDQFIHDETNDYDMRGAFQKGIKQGENFHWDDEFKKPNHITFSTGSKYNGVDGYQGGTWTKDDTGAYTYTPPEKSMYSDKDREKYWIDGDEAKNGNHLNTFNGKRLITGANADIKAGLATYPQNAQNRLLSEGNGLVDLGHGNYAEILPDGSTARYTGLAGKDLQEARQDVRDNPYKEDNPYILGMARMTKNALEGINMYPPKISPETQAMIDRINTIINGTPTNNSVGIGPRG